MPKKTVGIHACWWDRDCRQIGVPAFTYLNFWWFTIRINPPHDRLLEQVNGKKIKFRWRDLIQIWWNG